MMEAEKQKNQKKKRQGRISLLALVMLIVLCEACSILPGEEQPVTSSEMLEEGIRLYYLNEERTKVISEGFELEQGTVEEQLWTLLNELKDMLWTEEERALISGGNPVQGIKLHEETQAVTLYFASDYTFGYNILSVLRRAAIVKTLCQVEGVTYVEIYVGSQPLMRSNGKPVGLMKAEDFIDSTGENTEFYQVAVVTVYFANSEGDGLKEATLQITHDGTVSTERLVLEQLIKGPVSSEMQAVIPENTVLNKINIKDGVCYVDFSEEFLETRDGITPETAVYSVVNSLTELSNIYKVQFLIDGRVRKDYQGMDLSSAFERNLEMIEGE